MKVIDKVLGESSDEPIDLEVQTGLTLFRKGKICVNIIYPDLTTKTYYKKLKNPYYVNIKDDAYFLIPSSLIYLKKKTTGFWYFKNPKQLSFKYITSNLTSKDTYTKSELAGMKDEEKSQLMKIAFDTESLNTALTTNLFNSLYQKGGISTKQFIMIMGAIAIIILVILQLTGVVDIIGGLSEVVSGKKQ